MRLAAYRSFTLDLRATMVVMLLLLCAALLHTTMEAPLPQVVPVLPLVTPAPTVPVSWDSYTPVPERRWMPDTGPSRPDSGTPYGW